MTKPKTDAQRSQKRAEKRKAAGQVKISVSEWVLEGQEDVARAKMKRAVKKFAQPNPDNNKVEYT